MEPQTIKDTEYPLLTGNTLPSTGSNTDPVTTDSGALTPHTMVNQIFPLVPVAVETISQSINTATKSILGEFTFESLGAISIGEYKQGVSGEVRISPNGIVATNINGVTTFTLDGTTGNATFAGQLLAGSIVTGLLVVGNNNLTISVDGSGHATLLMNDGTNDRLLLGWDPNE